MTVRGSVIPLLDAFRFCASGEKVRAALQPSTEAAAHPARHKRDQEQYQRYEKHDLGNTDGGAGYSAEAKHGGNQRNDQQRYNKAQHLHRSLSGCRGNNSRQVPEFH
jgi:hypothetical protein